MATGSGSPRQLRIPICVPTGELPHEVIERRAEIGNDIARHRADLLLKFAQVRRGLDPETVIVNTRIAIGTNFCQVRLLTKRLPNVFINGIAMVFRAVDERPASLK